jgi:hypothetical protein
VPIKPAYKHELRLLLNDDAYMRFLSMQYQTAADSKEDVMIQMFMVYEALVKLARDNPGATFSFAAETGHPLGKGRVTDLFSLEAPDGTI